MSLEISNESWIIERRNINYSHRTEKSHFFKIRKMRRLKERIVSQLVSEVFALETFSQIHKLLRIFEDFEITSQIASIKGKPLSYNFIYGVYGKNVIIHISYKINNFPKDF